MKELTKLLQSQFEKMYATGKLFRSAKSGATIWKLYLEGFKKEHDPIFRDPESTIHNCNLCNNFIRRYGNIIAIDENLDIITLFDIEAPEEYAQSMEILSGALKSSIVNNIFIETFNELKSLPYEACKKTNKIFKLGIAKNIKRYTKEEAEVFGVVKPNEIRTFNHFHLDLPEQFVDTTGKSNVAIMAEYRDAKNVFQRAMEGISLDTLNLVKDLINQGSLLDGQTHLYKIEQIIPLKKEYDELLPALKNNWCWIKSHNLPFAKFRNELIGVLCSELSEGEEINKACQSWNKRVDPANYMKAIAPITKKQIEEAKKFVEDNNYEESFNRRFATIDDIKASEIKHMNVGDGKLKEVSIFDDVKSTSTRHKRNEFKNIEEVTIDKFMQDILPRCTSVEAFLTNSQVNNMMSLTTANKQDSKAIFKWPNNYSWTFNGNLAGKSQIKETVKSKGGKVDGILRFSIMWAEKDGDNSDLDVHCKEPDGNIICFSSKYSTNTQGRLDVDIQKPLAEMPNGAVENITYPTISKMDDGNYTFLVHQYASRSSKGFKAEIEFNGEIFSYEYNKPVSGKIPVAIINLKNGEFTINHKLPETNTSKKVYDLDTNQFHKVNLICLSPNHWNDIEVGNKHYFFMLDGCKTPTNIRSFHAENLIPKLAKHRKVLEVLGNTTMIEPSEKQLSGLGFNATVNDELIVKLQGSHKRIVRVKF